MLIVGNVEANKRLLHQKLLSEDYQYQETSGVAEALDRVNDKEYQLMKSYAELGEHILTPFVEDEDILEMVRHHHKHHRGSGYPGGLNGEQISIGARILAVS